MKKHREDFLLKYIFSTGMGMLLAAPLSVILVAIFQFTYLRSPQFMALIVWLILPALLSIMAIVGLRKLYHLVNPHSEQVDNAQLRLYEPPQNFPPLLLAHYVYHADFAELGAASFSLNGLDFIQVMQATVLDLIDRGNLKITLLEDQKILKIEHYEGLADFELAFISLLFDTEVEMPLHQLYKAFQIEATDFEHPHQVTVDEIKRYRRLLLGRFVSQKLRIRDLVQKEIERLQLPPLYQEKEQDKATITALKLLPLFAIGLLWVLSGLLLVDLQLFLWHYPILALLLGYYYTKVEALADDRLAILNSTGQEVRHLWISFQRMLVDIGNFKEKHIDDLVLWNRYLVYATFYGIVQAVDTELGTFDLALRYQTDETILKSLQNEVK